MRPWRRLCIVVVAVLAAAACGNSSTSTGPPPHGNVLMYGAPGEPDTLDPALGGSGFDQYYEKAIYDKLINTDNNMSPTVPGLATSWEFMGANKLTFRLHLRHGVQFQDGTPFNADAVKVTLDHYKTSPFWFDLLVVKSETVVDDYTIDLNLSAPYSPLPAILSFRAGMIISPTALQKYGANFGQHPVGTGPFTFQSWTPGAQIVLTKNNSYWNKSQVHFNGITYKIIPDTNAMTNALVAGQIDFAQLINLPAQDIAPLKARSNLVADVKQTLSPGIVTLDTTKPPFNNQQVRQATELSIDRKALTTAMVGKAGQGPAWQYVPPGYWAYTKDLKDWQYDPAKAKQMLAAAGYPNGITSRVCVFSNDTTKAATIEKQQMAPAGINLVLDQEPVNACFTLVTQGKDQMIQVGWFFLASPYQGYQTMFGARAGVPQYPGVDPVLQQATQVYTQQLQKPIYDQLNRMLYDLAPSVPTYWLVNPVAYTKRIQGMTFDINGQEHLDFAHF